MWFRLSRRLLLQELKRGELTIILAAIILAVSSVFALSMFSERLRLALAERGAEFLAADVVLESSRPLQTEWLNQAKQLGLSYSEQTKFRTMLFGEDDMLLGYARAVSNQYPLRGDIQVADEPWGASSITQLRVKPGEVWLDSKFFQALDIKLGDTVGVGDVDLVVSNIVKELPDQGFSFIAPPTILFNIADLPKANVLQAGSRAEYRVGFIGEKSAISEFESWLLPQLNYDVHDWVSMDTGDSPITNAINRAERYFLLASLLGIVLAATAIGVAAQRYSERHYDVVAILKTLGGTKQQIRAIFAMHLSMLTTVGVASGLALGYLGQLAVLEVIKDYLPETLPAAGVRPYWVSILTGLFCAGLFSVYPLLKLFAIPPLRVLRRQLEAYEGKDWLNYLLAGTAIFALMLLYSQSLQLSGALFVSGLLLVIVLLTVARLAIWSGRKAGTKAGSAFKLALAGLYRRAKANSVQLISFSIALKLLLIVLVIRNDLLLEWQESLEPGTPNHFLINVAEHEVEQLQTDFIQRDIAMTQLYPISRGRLVSVNGERVQDAVTKEDPDDADSDQRRSVGRELSFTTAMAIPKQNTIVEGDWWQSEQAVAQVSVESRIAERMKIKLGDVLTLNVGALEFEVPVTSIREVKWESMTPNFYMIFSPVVLDSFPATYIASFYVDESQKADLSRLMMQYPAASLIDVDAIIKDIREITEQVSLAVEFILVLVLFAGGLVLIAQVQASMDERKQELVVLRTLGAKASLLRGAVALEFVVLGAIAGLLASMATEVALLILQTQAFNMEPSFHWQYWLIGPVVGAVLVGALGLLSCAGLLRINTQQLVRSLS